MRACSAIWISRLVRASRSVKATLAAAPATHIPTAIGVSFAESAWTNAAPRNATATSQKFTSCIRWPECSVNQFHAYAWASPSAVAGCGAALLGDDPTDT
jgi:hypothetical protein